MYKDKSKSPNQLSYSVASYPSPVVDNLQSHKNHNDQITSKYNSNIKALNKQQNSSDMAFLRNTLGPTLTTNNQFLDPSTHNKKFDTSLRQTMNITSNIKDFVKPNTLGQTKVPRTQKTAQIAKITAKDLQQDRLQKIMSKYQKKNQTQEAIKLLQQLKQLKRKQQQLKKQRKNEQKQTVQISTKNDPSIKKQFEKKSAQQNNLQKKVNTVNQKKSLETNYDKKCLETTNYQIRNQHQTNDQELNKITQNTQNYPLHSPLNFSKKNKIAYFSPAHQKTNLLNTPEHRSINEKLSSHQFVNNQTFAQKNFLKKSQQLDVPHTPTLLGATFNKSTSNLKSFYEATNQSTTKPLAFTKHSNRDYTLSTSAVEAKYEYKPLSPYRITNHYNSAMIHSQTSDPSKEFITKSPISKYPAKESLNYLSSSMTYSTKNSKYDSYVPSNLHNSQTATKDVFYGKKLSIGDFQLGKTLGEGKFGTVYHAYDKRTKAIYALKKIPKATIKSHWMIDQFILQVKIQQYCNHPNILSLYGCFDDSQNVYILLEYMEEGTLFLHLKKNITLSEKEAAIKIKEIASSIQYLHENGIAHRDLKPENIVMSHGVCKLCDFGWATICDERRKTYCGTFDYAAPEILQGQEYDMSVDLWCLGILTYEVLVGKAPFYHISRKETMKKIMNCENQKINYPSSISHDARDFIQRLLKHNPEERLKSEDLLRHPFILNAQN